jgi:hypothetical protein
MLRGYQNVTVVHRKKSSRSSHFSRHSAPISKESLKFSRLDIIHKGHHGGESISRSDTICRFRRGNLRLLRTIRHKGKYEKKKRHHRHRWHHV